MTVSVVLWLIGLWAARAAGRADDRRSAWMMGSFVLAALVSYVLLICVFGPFLFGYLHSLRYSVPSAIAVAPASLALAAVFLESTSLRYRRAAIYAICLAVMAGFGFWFAHSAASRVERVADLDTTLSYYNGMTDEYLDYVDRLFDGPAQSNIEKMQQFVPAGEPVLVWINAPMFLDYARNPIMDVEGAGLSTSWARPPAVQYLIWQYRGFPTFSPAQLRGYLSDPGKKHQIRGARMLELIQRLVNQGNNSQVLYDDGSYVVLRILDVSKFTGPVVMHEK
jgi:hypothetical protein